MFLFHKVLGFFSVTLTNDLAVGFHQYQPLEMWIGSMVMQSVYLEFSEKKVFRISDFHFDVSVSGIVRHWACASVPCWSGIEPALVFPTGLA